MRSIVVVAPTETAQPDMNVQRQFTPLATPRTQWLAAVPMPVLLCDREGRIVDTSAALQTLIGPAAHHATGQTLCEVLATPLLPLSAWHALHAQAREAGHARTEALIHGTDGEPRWCEVTVQALPPPGDAHEAHWLVALQDVTRSRVHAHLQEPVLGALVRDTPLADVMTLVCRQAEALAPDVIATVLAVDEAGRVHPLAGPRFPPAVAAAFDGEAIGPAAGSCGTAAWRGEPVVVTDIATDPLWDTYRAAVLPLGLRACWSSPIKNRSGRVVATFAFYFHEPRGPHTLHRALVDMSVHLCTLALEREAEQARIRTLAYTDSLTGLPNRPHLAIQAQRAIEAAAHSAAPLALLFIDLDRFKTINDHHGHAMGDAVLRTVAQRLRDILPATALLGRHAGDEFVAVLPDCDAPQAIRWATALIDALSRPVALDTPATGVSIGAAIFPSDGADLDTLLRHADQAMYRAKASGRQRLALFSAAHG